MLTFQDLRVGMFLWWAPSGDERDLPNPICVTGVDIQKRTFICMDLETMTEKKLDHRVLKQMRRCKPLEVSDFVRARTMDLAAQKSRAAVELAQKTAKLKAYEEAAKPYLNS